MVKSQAVLQREFYTLAVRALLLELSTTEITNIEGAGAKLWTLTSLTKHG
jgi:hypothetical protein